jgi:acyl-CoA synthetase (NDP forming)
MAGERVAIISNAKSPFVLTAATLRAAGLEVAPSPRLDWRTTADDYADALRTALADDEVDAAIVIHAPPTFSAVDGPTDAIARAAEGSSKPIVAVMLGSTDGPLAPDSPIPTFSFPEQAAAVLSRVAAYSAWRRTEAAGEADHESTPIDRAGAEAIVARHLDTGTMPPAALADLLAGYGVAMPVTRLVDPADAVAAAHEIGYPVAVKAIGRRVGRSVEAGIALDLSDDGDVEEAVELMAEHLGDDAAQVHVQRMVPPGADLRIHVTHDERVGPVITVGIGGLQADAIGDETSRLAPVSSATANSMVAATRAAALLDDAELHMVADQVTRVAQLASDHVEIAELDLNPVIVSDRECWVADARIVLRREERQDTVLRRLD